MILLEKAVAYDLKMNKAEYEKALSMQAHTLLERVLEAEYGIKRAILLREKGGKPFLQGREEVKFNITHCDGLIGIVIGETPAGIDAERIRPWNMAVMKKMCSQSEIERILQSNNQDEMFFRYFTLKEAYGKAAGFGLSYPLKDVTFTIDSDRVICRIGGYDFRQYVIENRYVLSVCYKKGQDKKEEEFDG